MTTTSVAEFLEWLGTTSYMDTKKCTVRVPPDVVKRLYDELVEARAALDVGPCEACAAEADRLRAELEKAQVRIAELEEKIQKANRPMVEPEGNGPEPMF